MEKNIFNIYKDILDRAFKCVKNAYAPYSNYQVGACVKTKDGKYHIGTNVENASYGLTNCAERTALFNVFSQGYRKNDIESMALVTCGNTLGTPCGACRQVMVELLEKDTPIIIANKNNEVIVTTVDKLLPFSFSNEDLK